MNTPLAVTLGDPAGIGPEIVVKAWTALRHSAAPFVVIGDPASLTRSGGAGVPIRAVASAAEGAALFSQAIPVMGEPLPALPVLGRPAPEAALHIIGWIDLAVSLALAGEVTGVVTAPIAKATLYDAGFKFPGHTEYLGVLAAPAAGARGKGPLMMLTAADLRVALVTIHEPLARVSSLLTVDLIVNAGLITADALKRDFGIAWPRLAVTGLNPHAGESGALGREEIEIIVPAIDRLRAHGVDVSGPHPSDSLFHSEARRKYDAALCMYHDQALIPVKMLDFWGGVNITLGLPIVRTSPDHGVGYDIAGKDLARAESLIAALHAAGAVAARRAAE